MSFLLPVFDTIRTVTTLGGALKYSNSPVTQKAKPRGAGGSLESTAKPIFQRTPLKVTERVIPNRRTIGSVPGFVAKPSGGGAGGVSAAPLGSGSPGGIGTAGIEALTAALGRQGYKALLGQ